MTKLIWHGSGDRIYNAGVDRGVIFPRHGDPAAWNGLTSVVEAPSDVVIEARYFDGKKQQRATTGSFAATINAFTYPDSLLEYFPEEGLSPSMVTLKEFDFSYRTLIGNDIEGIDYASKIHLVYNALVTPTASNQRTVDNSTDIDQFSWGLSTRPVKIPGYKPSAHLIVNTSVARDFVVEDLEDILYGTDTTPPRMPSAQEIIDLFESATEVTITDHGDGTWTADGPDSAVYLTGATQFEISWPSAVYIDENTYTVSSL